MWTCGHLQSFWISAVIPFCDLGKMAVVDLCNWSTGEVVGCWIKEDLVVGGLQSDWTPYYLDLEKEEVLVPPRVHKQSSDTRHLAPAGSENMVGPAQLFVYRLRVLRWKSAAG